MGLIRSIKKRLRMTQSILGLRKDTYAKEFYSQYGEDVLLQSLFGNNATDGKYAGFYIDIGAHHPTRFSNTYLFYKQGWRGINIDATPESMNEFNRMRKRDTNLEFGISDICDELEYYSFNEPALNSFNKALSEERINGGCRLKEVRKVKTYTINDVLTKYMPPNQHIDFITIDIEGLDLVVLQTLNFEKYAPDFFIVEDTDLMDLDITEYYKSHTYCFLKQKGYKLVAKTVISLIFKKELAE